MSAALHCESVGAGAPLVLLHGWAMHSGMWGSLPAQLARRQRVHCVDLPGHGHSAPLERWSLDAIVAVLAAAFADEKAPLTLVGWSLGGLVALEWARASPARIGRLVLIATTPCFVARPGWPHAMDAQTLVRFGDELRVAYRATLMRFLTLQLQGTDDGKAALAAMRARMFERPEPSRATLADALDVLATRDRRDIVATLAQPTLVVAGERDTLAPPGAGAWLAASMPHATFVEIAGAAHAPFLSHPAAFSAALGEFFAATDGASRAR